MERLLRVRVIPPRLSVSQAEHSCSTSNAKVRVTKCVERGGLVYMTGSVEVTSTGWIDASVTGAPAPISEAGITWARNNGWAEPVGTGSLTTNGTLRFQIDRTMAQAANWSVVYATD